MSLYKFFSRVGTGTSDNLTDPQGPLIPSSSILAANAEVGKCGQTAAGKKRNHYAKFTSEQKAEIGHRAVEHGVASTICYYASQFTLKESTIRGWKDYLKEVKMRKSEKQPMSITKGGEVILCCWGQASI